MFLIPRCHPPIAVRPSSDIALHQIPEPVDLPFILEHVALRWSLASTRENAFAPCGT